MTDDAMRDQLRRSGDHLLDGIRAADAGEVQRPPDGQWDADQILGHVSLVNAATLATVYAVTAGVCASYDNRLALDPWTIGAAVDACGGRSGIAERLDHQIDALIALADSLSESERGTHVPAVLVSGDTVLVDQTLSLHDIVAGLAGVEWPNHTRQLLALVS